MVEMVSTIVPMYNASNYIARTIKDLQNQDYKNVEFLLVDDDSTDDTVDICEQLIKNDNRFNLFSISHGGQGRARNFGIKQSSGKYLSFLDADDRISGKFISMLVYVLELHEADIAECGYYISSKQTVEFEDIEVDNVNASILVNNIIYDLLKNSMVTNINSVPVWNKIYKKELFNNIEFDENNNQSEDLLINLKIFKSIKKIARIRNKLYLYYQNNGSTLHQPVTKSDLDIIATHKQILTFLDEYSYEEYVKKIARQKLSRVYFNLILRCIRNGVSSNFKKNEFDKITKTLEEDYVVLLTSDMQLNRKIMVIVLVISIKLKFINFKMLRKRNAN